MSINRETYVVLGYDLSDQRDAFLTDEFVWSDEYENMTNSKCVGEIQVFSDPMSEEYMYAGYIVGYFDDYYNAECVMVDTESMGPYKEEVDAQLKEWGLNTENYTFQVLVFTEFT